MLFASPHQTGPRGWSDIVRTGLTQHLDALDQGSYPGAGQTWSDLTGNGYHMSLGADAAADGSDPVWNAAGYFTLDGGDDFTSAAAYAGSLLRKLGRSDTPFTAEVWLYYVAGGNCPLFGSYQTASYSNGLLGLGLSSEGKLNGSTYPGPAGPVGADIVMAAGWHQWSLSGQPNGTSMRHVLDGGAQAETVTWSSTWHSGDSLLPLCIGRSGPDGSNWYAAAGTRIAILRLYDRALSDGEIARNYAVQCGRFGL